MATSSTEAAPATGPTSLLSRFVGIITSPKATFQEVVTHPRWLGMLALTTILIAICVSAPMTTEAGRQAALDNNVRMMESFGMQVSDQMYEGMSRGMRFAPYQTAISILVFSPIMGLIMAGILFAIFAAMGGQATFKQLFTVLAHASVISAVGQLFTGPLNYFRGSVSSATNLAVLMPMIDDTSFLGKLLGMLDIFIVWWLVVLAIGLGVLYRRRTQPIAIALFGIYFAIILVLAAVMSSFGGSGN